MWTTLLGAGPWAAFLALLLWLLYAYHRGRIISPAEYQRRVAALAEERDRAVDTERRIGGYHEKRADKEGERADRATEALMTMSAQLPEALHRLRAGRT